MIQTETNIGTGIYFHRKYFWQHGASTGLIRSGKVFGKLSFSLRSGNVRESQGKSGKLAMVRGNIAVYLPTP